MNEKIIDIKLLKLYDKYNGDFGLLLEPWANKFDKKKVTAEKAYILSKYIDLYYSINLKNISNSYKNTLIKERLELKKHISDEVIKILEKRGL